jgi:hypothetical protein
LLQKPRPRPSPRQKPKARFRRRQNLKRRLENFSCFSKLLISQG